VALRKVARTLAGLDAEANLARLLLAEALSYRSRVADSI
jgi:predicted ATPase with chaperone activity